MSTLFDCSKHGTFASSVNGAAYHASWCPVYRAEQGIPEDAPGVRPAKADKAEPTLDGVMARLAAKSEPTATAEAAEVVIEGVRYRRA